LNGRTTDKESPHKAGKNGAAYLFSCLESHNPLGLVIIALGKNELKEKYKQTPESIGRGIEDCIDMVIKEGKTVSGKTPKMLILPPAIIEEKERMRFGKVEVDFKGGREKAIKLLDVCKKIAERRNANFFDVNEVVKVSEIDGIHMDEGSHKHLGEKLCSIIKELI